jgi:hypothetical protein
MNFVDLVMFGLRGPAEFRFLSRGFFSRFMPGPQDHTVPYGTGLHSLRISRQFLPGYDQSSLRDRSQSRKNPTLSPEEPAVSSEQ